MVRYRRSKKIGPFRITLTQRGVSTSVGAGPFRIGKGADGKVRRTIRVPGAGIYDTKVVSRSPKKLTNGRGQQSPMQSGPNRPPQLPPAGWYADPTGEASLRYWDGRQWTSATDAIPAALKQHQCPAVVGEERALAVGKVRGMRVIVAALRDDDKARDEAIDELEGCALCMRLLVTFLASVMPPVFFGFAQGNKALAIAEAEKVLKQYIDEA